ncbi:MAG: phosphopantothenoylcysteine decarboxylase [Planctomycetes bacterium]|nr:phosphopantothenoylcysteine decarboxylase [Planctomycetota bacterium]
MSLAPVKARRILIAITGGIAAYKICNLCSTLKKNGAEVRVIMTEMAKELVGPKTFQALTGHPVIDEDKVVWAQDGMDHIHLNEWAEVMLIAPCTANTIAKLALGIADELVSTTSLACPVPQIIAPAMNPTMWEKASVQRNIQTLEDDGFMIVPPEKGVVACGHEGFGRLAAEAELLAALMKALK